MAIVGEQAARHDRILLVELEAGSIEHMLHQGGQVAGIEGAGVVGNRAGQAIATDQLHPVALDGLAADRAGTVTTLGHGQVNHHRTGPHARQHLLRDQQRGPPAGH